MDRGNKGAPYYMSGLRNRSNIASKFDINEKHHNNCKCRVHNNYPSRIANIRFQPSQNDQQHPSEQHNRQFVQTQMMSMQQQQQLSTPSQPQYLISNNDPQHLTNLTPHLFNQQNLNNNSPFQHQIHSTNYHVNSNHHLYQASAQQQQAQSRTSLFQHHKSPSLGDDGHPKIQNQVIFHENKQQLSGDQLQQIGTNDRSNITASQSMTQGEFNRLRRKSEHLDLTSEVGLESLNLEFEAMLMNDGQNVVSNNNNHMIQKQHPNSGPNIDKLLRNLVTQQNNNITGDRTNNNNDMPSGASYGRPTQQDVLQRSNKDPAYLVYNRSEDNIYE